MKRIVLLIAVASAWSICAFSQAPRPLQVGIGTGWALPQGKHAKPGPLFYLEPTYGLSNNFTVGLRTEYVMMQRGTNEVYSYASPFNPSRRGGGSVTLNGQYCFSKGLKVSVVGTNPTDQERVFGRFRPFIGAGAGVFFYTPYIEVINSVSVAQQALGVSQHEVSGGAKFGCYPKVGFMTGRFTFTAQYNMVFGKSSETYTALYSDNGNGVLPPFTITNTVNNNYLSFKVGFLW